MTEDGYRGGGPRFVPGAEAPAGGGDRLADLSRRLEEAAARLRDDDLDREEATRLAGECAELASEAAVELERAARGVPAGSVPGQEDLLSAQEELL
jgi:hypothetical protein